MKIYVEPLGQVDEIENQVSIIIARIPFIPEETHDIAKTLGELAVQQHREVMRLHQDVARLKLQWHLKAFEQEIEEEGGNFVIATNSEISINGFSPTLGEKLRQHINEQFDK